MTTMYVIDDALVTKWVEALKSGRYAQGQRRLRTDEGKYCCLGVLCDIVYPDGWGDEDGDDGAEFYASDDFAPQRYIDMDIQNTLAQLNDEGASFKEIAQVIESGREAIIKGDGTTFGSEVGL